MLKAITIFNWIVIAILAFLVIAEALSPHKGGGDAAGRGIGQALYYLAIAALVILLILNLLPYKATRIAALVLIVIPIAYYKINPYLDQYKRRLAAIREEAKPIFDHPELERLARLIRDGEVAKLKEALSGVSGKWKEKGELLGYAIAEASHSSYRPEEKLECVQVLFDAGATLDSLKHMDVAVHFPAATNGNAPVLNLLLEHGADANAFQPYFERPILFEALGGYQQPAECVRLLLEHGADPNALMTDDGVRKTPLQVAAEMERWGLCAILLEKGADPNRASRKGQSFRDWVQEEAKDFHPDGYTSREDVEELLNKIK
ncbi:MAG: ankyrin repeat domain-containing protein [Saprospiraceae bacterium]|nr:ankyrin repeat domain-containing protein [Saprospiraceae bacterium]